MKFSVPLLPPSVNHYKQPKRGGGWYRAADAIAFVDAVCLLSRSAHCQVITGNCFELELAFYLGPGRNRGQNDLDNYSKVAIDALVRAGVVKNDARVFDLHLHKRFVTADREERTEYAIRSRHITEEELLCLPIVRNL